MFLKNFHVASVTEPLFDSEKQTSCWINAAPLFKPNFKPAVVPEYLQYIFPHIYIGNCRFQIDI